MNPIVDVKPVRDVQIAYFELLRQHFGAPYEQMRKHNLSPGSLAAHMCTKTSLVKAFETERYELISTFVDFWGERQDLVNNYLRDAEMMKSFFGGDISPMVELGHLSSTLLYTDTMVIQCPVLRLIPVIEMSQKEGFRLLIKHSLNIMRFDQLALADVEPPIFLVTGSAFAINEEYRKSLIKASEPYVLAQAKALLGRDFAGTGELEGFVSQIKNEDEAIALISDPSRALFDTEWNGSLADQFRRSVLDLGRFPGGLATAGFSIHSLISGRMLQANEIVLLNSSIRATPLLSAPTSWQYLLWRYEFDAAFADGDASQTDLVTTNAIFTRGGRNEIPLISELSIEGVVALRREGAMGSLRELMRRSIQRIDIASRNDLKTVSQEVSRELGDAFDKHHSDLDDLKTGKKRFYGVDVLSSIATGALTLAGAATGNIPLATLGALSNVLFGSKSIPALRDTWLQTRTKHQEIKRSPAAMLLRIIGRT